MSICSELDGAAATLKKEEQNLRRTRMDENRRAATVISAPTVLHSPGYRPTCEDDGLKPDPILGGKQGKTAPGCPSTFRGRHDELHLAKPHASKRIDANAVWFELADTNTSDYPNLLQNGEQVRVEGPRL